MTVGFTPEQVFKLHQELNFIKGILIGKFENYEVAFSEMLKLTDKINDNMKQYEINK